MRTLTQQELLLNKLAHKFDLIQEYIYLDADLGSLLHDGESRERAMNRKAEIRDELRSIDESYEIQGTPC